MKKIKIFSLTFLLIFILFPCLVKAATFLEASTQKPTVGSDVYILLSARYGDFQMSIMNLRIKYDPSILEFEQTYWIQSSGTVDVKDGYIYIKKPDNGRNWTAGNQMQFKFKVLRTGITSVEIDGFDENGVVTESYYSNGDPIAQSFANVTLNAVNPSTNTYLSNLSVDGYTISPSFNQSVYEYHVTVPSDVTEVNINANKGDANQTITGIGKKTLNYGPNRVRIVVSAQDGSSRTYQLMINRTDNRTGDTTLKSLSVSNTNISYQQDKQVYEAIVSRSVESVLITAIPTDGAATIVGTGTKQLNIGLNTFILQIQSSNGAESNYTINITRSNEELENVIQSSKLQNLKINNLALLIGSSTNFLYSVNKDTNYLNIEYTTESTTATVEITGNENFKPGLNLVTITVTEKNNDKTEYNLIIYKHPANPLLVTSLNSNINSDIIYETSLNDNHTISSSLLNTLKTYKYKMYYDVVDTYGGLLYQVILEDNLPSNDLDISFTKEQGNNLTYQTKIPEGNEILLYLEGKYKNGDIVRIYSYNEPGQYNLITDGVTVNNGYVSFLTNGDTNYLITTNDLIKPESPITKFFNKYKSLFIIFIILIIAIIIVIIFINKQKKIKDQNEPLY